MPKRILVGVVGGLVVCALLYALVIRPFLERTRMSADLLLLDLEELELGMTREALLQLRGKTLQSASFDRDTSPILSEVVEANDQRRNILYLVSGEPPVLETIMYTDDYPSAILDERIERKLRSATERWGQPRSLSAEKQASLEYFVVVWAIDADTVLAISYVPSDARKDDAKMIPGVGRFPVVTRFFPADQLDQVIRRIEPVSFDFGAERSRVSEQHSQGSNE